MTIEYRRLPVPDEDGGFTFGWIASELWDAAIESDGWTPDAHIVQHDDPPADVCWATVALGDCGQPATTRAWRAMAQQFMDSMAQVDWTRITANMDRYVGSIETEPTGSPLEIKQRRDRARAHRLDRLYPTRTPRRLDPRRSR